MSSDSHISAYVLVALACLVFYSIKLIRVCLYGSLSSIPGPILTRFTTWPIVFHDIAGRRPQYCHILHQRYGPVVRLSPSEVSVTSVPTAKTIYSVASRFHKTSFYTNLASSPNGYHSVFSETQPEVHSRKRKLLGADITATALSGTFEPLIRQKVDRTAESIRGEMAKFGHADVYKWITFMATDVIGQLSFGSSFEMLELGKKTQYSLDLEQNNALQAIRTFLPVTFKLLSSLRIPPFSKHADIQWRIWNYASQSVERHHRQMLVNPDDTTPTLLSKLYAVEKTNPRSNGNMDTEELTEEARAYIIAGTDTTAASLTYLLWALAKHPTIQHDLRQELNTLPQDFTVADLKHLKLLNHVITETLRLYAAAPAGLPRTVPAPGLSTNGYYIPPGTTVSSQAYSLHRDESIFPNAEFFIPSRWEAPTQAMKEAYMPFGGGSRVCLGKHLGMMELQLATAVLLRSFPQGLEVATGATLQAEEEQGSDEKAKGFSDEDMEMEIHFLMAPRGHRCLLREMSASA